MSATWSMNRQRMNGTAIRMNRRNQRLTSMSLMKPTSAVVEPEKASNCPNIFELIMIARIMAVIRAVESQASLISPKFSRP